MGEQPVDHSTTERTGLSKKTLWVGGIGLFAIFAILASISGGSGSTTEEPEASATYESAVSMDDQYVALVRANTTTLDGVSDATLIVLAEQACTALDNGAEPLELVATAMDGMNTQAKSDDAIRAMGMGISAYCPEHGEDL